MRKKLSIYELIKAEKERAEQEYAKTFSDFYFNKTNDLVFKVLAEQESRIQKLNLI